MFVLYNKKNCNNKCEKWFGGAQLHNKKHRIADIKSGIHIHPYTQSYKFWHA